MLPTSSKANSVPIPNELRNAPAATLETYVLARIKDFSTAFATQLSPNASLQSVEAAYSRALYSLSAPDASTPEWSLKFRHRCRHLGCKSADCSLCRHNPLKTCGDGDIFDEYYACNTPIATRCGAEITVELHPNTLDALQHAAGLHIMVSVVDGEAFNDSGVPSPFVQPTELLQSDSGELLLTGPAGTRTDGQGRLLLPMKKGRVRLEGLQLQFTNDRLQAEGRRFGSCRLLFRAVRISPDTNAQTSMPSIRQATSGMFVVKSAAEIAATRVLEHPHTADSVLRLRHVSTEAAERLQSAGRLLGPQHVPEALHHVVTVGQLQALVQHCGAEEGLKRRLVSLMGLVAAPFEWQALERVLRRQVISNDDYLRVWYKDEHRTEGLLFSCRQGQVAHDRPVGLLTRLVVPQMTKMIVDPLPTDRDKASEVPTLTRIAQIAWSQPFHPGWSKIEQPLEWTGLSRPPSPILRHPLPVTGAGIQEDWSTGAPPADNSGGDGSANNSAGHTQAIDSSSERDLHSSGTTDIPPIFSPFAMPRFPAAGARPKPTESTTATTTDTSAAGLDQRSPRGAESTSRALERLGLQDSNTSTRREPTPTGLRDTSSGAISARGSGPLLTTASGTVLGGAKRGREPTVPLSASMDPPQGPPPAAPVVNHLSRVHLYHSESGGRHLPIGRIEREESAPLAINSSGTISNNPHLAEHGSNNVSLHQHTSLSSGLTHHLPPASMPHPLDPTALGPPYPPHPSDPPHYPYTSAGLLFGVDDVHYPHEQYPPSSLRHRRSYPQVLDVSDVPLPPAAAPPTHKPPHPARDAAARYLSRNLSRASSNGIPLDPLAAAAATADPLCDPTLHPLPDFPLPDDPLTSLQALKGLEDRHRALAALEQHRQRQRQQLLHILKAQALNPGAPSPPPHPSHAAPPPPEALYDHIPQDPRASALADLAACYNMGQTPPSGGAYFQQSPMLDIPSDNHATRTLQHQDTDSFKRIIPPISSPHSEGSGIDHFLKDNSHLQQATGPLEPNPDAVLEDI